MGHFKCDKSRYGPFYLDEREMNITGLGMFYNGYKSAGIEVLRLNTVLFPNQ